MRHLHKHHGVYPTPLDTTVVGICTGSIAAAAIACCRSLSELLPRALEAVNISFRVGRLVSNVANCINISSSAEDSWALAIHGLSREEVTEILVHFEESQVGLF